MADVIDEALLKSVSLGLRFFQIALSLVVVGGIGQFITDISNGDLSVPGGYVAVVAISSTTAMWSGIALILTCCAGKIMLGIETSLDLLCVLLSIAESVLLGRDALSSESDFAFQYSQSMSMSMMGVADPSNDQSLVRMAFVIAIILM